MILLYFDIMIDSSIFSKEISKSFNWLIDLGFSLKEEDSNVLFEKARVETTLALGFSWTEYNKILINGFTAFKRFNLVENLIQEVLGGELDFTIKHRWHGEIPSDFVKISDPQFFQDAFLITDTIQMPIFSNMLKCFFENEVAIFDNKFSSLSTILDEIDLLPSNEKSSFIVNTSNSTFLRILAIKHLVNPLEGQKFYEETVKELSPLKNQRVFYQILQNLDRLFLILSRQE